MYYNEMKSATHNCAKSWDQHRKDHTKWLRHIAMGLTPLKQSKGDRYRVHGTQGTWRCSISKSHFKILPRRPLCRRGSTHPKVTNGRIDHPDRQADTQCSPTRNLNVSKYQHLNMMMARTKCILKLKTVSVFNNTSAHFILSFKKKFSLCKGY